MYETPADMARFALGAAICLTLFGLLFFTPKNRDEDRAWLYLGLAAAPLTGLLVYAS